MAPNSSTLALKIPWMEESGRLQSMGSLRVGHDWATSLSLFTFLHWQEDFLPLAPLGKPLYKCESKSAQLCLTLCDPMDHIDHGILQVRILEWVTYSFSRGSSPPRNGTGVSCIAMLCYTKSLQSCPTLCDPMDGSPPGSPVPGILQARTLEWVAISFSNA